jgi:hypothetical protein
MNKTLIMTVMVYTRPPASDYDDWGVEGWESENLIPLMKKVSNAFSGHLFKLLICSIYSWRHMRCSPIFQLTAMMDLSRCPMVGVK